MRFPAIELVSQLGKGYLPMIGSLLVAASLATAQPGGLEIVNARPTYGFLGGTRTERNGAVPGETIHYAFEVKGIRADENSRVLYATTTQILDEAGDVVFQFGPVQSGAQLFLGGDTIPCVGHVTIPPDMKPGTYTFRVKIDDRKSKRSGQLSVTFKVVPVQFRLVNIGTFADPAGKVPATPVGVIGESLYVGFSAVGFQRDKESGQPNISLALRIFDDRGKPTMKKPLTGTVKSGVDRKARLLPAYTVGFTLNRTGRFVVELAATDNVSGATSRVRFPILVTKSP